MVILISLIPFLIIGQPQVKGIVLNMETGEFVPFAHVMTLDGDSGAISGIDGTFTLSIRSGTVPDSLKITSLGYVEQIIPVDQTRNLIVKLIPKIYEMDDISVYAEDESQSVIMGTVFSPNVLYGWPSFSTLSGLGETLSSFAIPINWPFEKPFTPEIARIRMAVTADDSVMIRVRMLSRHPETGLPHKDLLYEQIISSKIDENGWVDFRFEAGKYWFHEKKMFLVFDWVSSSSQSSYIAPMFTQKNNDDGSYFLYRHSSDNEWTKTEKELIYSLFARY